jgi:hypothetical protein
MMLHLHEYGGPVRLWPKAENFRNQKIPDSENKAAYIDTIPPAGNITASEDSLILERCCYDIYLTSEN